MIKIQWLASIWRQNDQNVELRRKTFKTKLNYKSDQNPMTCIDLTSKRSKCWGTSQNIQNKAKLQKWSKSNDLHRFDVKTLRYKTFKTKLNYKSDQNPMSCIDLTSKRSKCWVTSQNIQNKAKLQKWSKSNDLHRFDVKTIKMYTKHSKQKTTKLIKLQWIASLWCQNDQKTQNYKIKSNYDKFASIWRQNDQNVELRRKTFKTKQNYKSDQNPMTCIDLTSKRSKCWVTSQNIQNKAKLQKWSKSNDLHRLDVKTIIKTKLNYKSDQNRNDLHRLTKTIKMLSQNKAKLQKWSKSNDLHRFDVKTNKTFKTKLNYKSDQNPMTCIDLTSKRSKCWVTSQNIQNKAKLQKWSKSNDLHRFDVKTIKMLSYVAKHSKQSETTKVIKIQWLASIGCQNDQNKAKLQKWSKSNTCIDLTKRTKHSKQS